MLKKIFVIIIILAYSTKLATKIPTQKLHKWSQSLAETLHIVNSKAYHHKSLDQAMLRALNALVQCDDYSYMLTAKDYTRLIEQTSGEFYGTGIFLAPKKTKDDCLLILDVIPDSPAGKQSVRPHDKISAINSIPISKLSLAQATEYLRGTRPGETVSLEILRANKKTFTVNIVKKIIQEQQCLGYYFPQYSVLYCAIQLFSQHTHKQLEKLLSKSLQQKKPAALILDLRNNAGGLLQAAVDCVGFFVEKNSKVVSTQNKNNQFLQHFYTKILPLVYNMPIIILVNNYTASSAEIVAGALKFHAANRSKDSIISPFVFIIGERTFGKGSVQELISIKNNYILKLTTCHYVLPDNTSIEKIGIEPDFICKNKRAKNNNTSACKQIMLDKDIQASLNIINLLYLGLKTEKLETRNQALTWLKNNYISDMITTVEQLF